MQKIVRFVWLGLLIFIPAQLFAQEAILDRILLNEMYVGTLSSILDTIAHQKGVKIVFDHNRFDQINTMIRPVQEPLSSVITGIAKAHRLRYFPGTDGTVYLIDRVQTNTESTETMPDLPKKDFSIAAVKSNFAISGKVRDRTTGEAIPFAIVSVQGTKTITNANVDGHFTILKTPTDTSTLLVYSVGYRKLEYFLTPSMEAGKLILDMYPEVTSIDQVVITSDKKELVLSAKEELSMVKLSPKKIAELPNIGEKDILRSFQLMPGISASNESSSGLYVRGGTPDQNLILYDGFTVYHVDHLYGFFSAFNANAVKDINLYKGGFESKYGGRLSSVTEITGKDGNKNEVSGGGDISLLSANAFIEIPIGKKFTSVIAARRSYQGLLYDKLFKKFNTSSGGSTGYEKRGPFSSSEENTVSSYFYDVNGKFTYRPGEKDIISLSIYNGADNLDNSREMGGGFRSFNASVNDITDFGNLGTSAKWSRQWNNKWYSNTLVSFSEYYSNRDRSNGTTITRDDSTRNVRFGTMEDNKLKDYSVKSAVEYQLSDNQRIETGFILTKNSTSYNYSQNDTSSILDRNDNGIILSTYLQDKIQLLNKKLTITPGLRNTWYNNTSKIYLEPRISMGIDITSNIKFSASFGKYYQFISRVMREDISSGGRDFWIMADDKHVPVSSAYHYIAGVSYDTPDFLYSIEGYYKNLSGITEYSMRMIPAQRQLSYEENFYNGRGYAKGLEFLVQKKSGAFSGWMSYTLGQARNQFDAFGSNYFASLQDVRHEYKSVGIYKYKRWTFSGTWIFATGRPYTAPLGSYTLTLIDGNTQGFVGVGAKNAARFPNYHRMDLAVTMNFKYFDQLNDGMLTFSLFNVYNRKNIWYKEFQIIDGENIENNITYLGITPNISLSLKF